MTAARPGLGIDLELVGGSDPKAQRLRLGGAVFDTQELRLTGSPKEPQWQELDRLAEQAGFLFNHNLLAFDLPWLQHHQPNLRLHELPHVDTLVLSVIAFAEYPYHALVKNDKLLSLAHNDPVADVKSSQRVLDDCTQRMREIFAMNPQFVRATRTLGERGLPTWGENAARGFALWLATIAEPSVAWREDVEHCLRDRVCATALHRWFAEHATAPTENLAMLFAFAWLRASATAEQPSSSMLMPWIARRVPRVRTLLQELRDHACSDSACSWCVHQHDPRGLLQRWFSFPEFRDKPSLADGRSAQAAIVAAGLRGESSLSILPTGGGKSLCFQLPAIAAFVRRGSLTLVISPLQSLMHDQVDNLRLKLAAFGMHVAALTGRLNSFERARVLDDLQTGRLGILYVAPEQLRNPGFERAITVREIAAVVFDEAHCLSKWGHDFRPDYLHAARFVGELARNQGLSVPPIHCLTATAKPAVTEEIVEHFRSTLGVELTLFDGHAPRENLTLHVEAVSAGLKQARLREILAETVSEHTEGCAIVYASTRAITERVAAALRNAGFVAEAFHAGLEPPEKAAVQARFLNGETRIVVATNAFGMGIDKPDVRRVVHYDIPGSLEAYVQEVGRAGRDLEPADAILLYDESDVERQFRLLARSALHHRDLAGILRRIRSLAKKRRSEDPRDVYCSSGEIVRDADLHEHFDPDDRGTPTRVVTAIAWLERGNFVVRGKNQNRLFMGYPRVQSIPEVDALLAQSALEPDKRALCRAIMLVLFSREPDESLSTDDFLGLDEFRRAFPRLDAPSAGSFVVRLLLDMATMGLLKSGLQMSAFVDDKVRGGSKDRLHHHERVQESLLDLLREESPDADDEQWYPLDVARLARRMAERDEPVDLETVHRWLANQRSRAANPGSRENALEVQASAGHQVRVRLRADWQSLQDQERRRATLRACVLEAILAKLPANSARGKGLLAEFTMDELLSAARGHLELHCHEELRDVPAIESALLHLHDFGILHLQKGLAIFRQAMHLELPKATESRQFHKSDFDPLARHQTERISQVHFMNEFAERMQQSRDHGLAFLADYFTLPAQEFEHRHFDGRSEELCRATTRASLERIVANASEAQRAILEAPVDGNLLVLAGPGSGKTRVVVHRCAWLIRVQNVPAKSILMVCYNRDAANEMKRRLRELLGDDARGVLIQTWHGLAMRLCGGGLVDLDRKSDESPFDALIESATLLLREAAGAADDEALRDRLLAGFRHVLVDEYQDIDGRQYELLSAITGRRLDDQDRKLSILAVGDDDQAIYGFRGANVDFLRRFEADYGARRVSLLENFRSSQSIVECSSALIARNPDRLKAGAELLVGAVREAPPEDRRVRVVRVADTACLGDAAVRELVAWDARATRSSPPTRAILAREHGMLHGIRARLSAKDIPFAVRLDAEAGFSWFKLREVQEFLAAIDATAPKDQVSIDAAILERELAALASRRGTHRDVLLVRDQVEQLLDTLGDSKFSPREVREFIGEALRERRRGRVLGDGVLLSTLHGSKGLEFDEVLVVGVPGAQDLSPGNLEETRRLFYVGMTRARSNLSILACRDRDLPLLADLPASYVESIEYPDAERSRDEPHYEVLSLAHLHLSWPARKGDHAAIARAIDGLVPGSELRVVERDAEVILTDSRGARVGALSSKGRERFAEWKDCTIRATCLAILRRTREEEFAAGYVLQDDAPSAWHVVIPEFAVTRR